jgi:FKBP-type peptidyl-prolyl cis-trans isomerase
LDPTFLLPSSMRTRRIALFAVLALVAGCTPNDPARPSDPSQETFAASLDVDIASMTRIGSTPLYFKDIVVGTGATVAYGKTISVNYSGYLKDGTRFDTNVGGDPFEGVLNDANFIAGWTSGLPGMKAGGVRKLVVGSAYGYGAAGAGNGKIPGHATLVFDVFMSAVK